MKITVLGSGAAISRLPNLPVRFPPGFLIEFNDDKLLLEASSDIQNRLEKIGVNYASLRHIAISHSHPDHFALIQFLQTVHVYGSWGDFKNPGITVYAPKAIVDTWDQLVKIHFPNLNWNESHLNAKVEFVTPPVEKANIGEATLSWTHVYHQRGQIEALAFRLEHAGKVLVYSGDCGWDENLITLAKDADLFICEATARVGDGGSARDFGHLNPEQVGEIAKAAGVKHVVLTHYTGLDNDEVMLEDCKASGFVGEISLAKDFQVFEI